MIHIYNKQNLLYFAQILPSLSYHQDNINKEAEKDNTRSEM